LYYLQALFQELTDNDNKNDEFYYAISLFCIPWKMTEIVMDSVKLIRVLLSLTRT